jgi:ankyrin repeat protein
MDAGADVNRRARDGRTALAAAEAIGDTQTTSLLLSAGAGD